METTGTTQKTQPEGTGFVSGLFVKLSDGTYQPMVDATGHGVFSANCVTSAPGLEIAGGSGSALVSNTGTIKSRYQTKYMVPIAPSYTFPVLGGGNLANDYCRMYTFFLVGNTETGATTLSVENGEDFFHDHAAGDSDTVIGDGSKAIVGYLYVKNESGSAFVPGTTHLDASGITALFQDAFGFSVL